MNKVVTFGEIMLRLTTPGYSRFGQENYLITSYGGAEASVAVSLANYGVNAKYVTRLPDNDIAEACIRELRGFGVDTTDIVRGGKRMGVYYLETGAVNRGSKVIYDRAHSAMAEIAKGMINWEKVFDGATWFHWSGITPALSQNAADICLEAVKKANEMGITVSTDLNYRKALWNYGKAPNDVMPALVEGCDVVLGNEEDAAMTLNIHPDGVDVTSGHVEADAYHSVSQKIMGRFPRVKKVITTLRGSISANHNSWSGVLYNGNTLYKSPTYQITHIVDRVGGGDSFMGGLIYGLLTYGDNELQSALNFAVAASCLKHTIYADYNRVTVAEVLKLMSGDASGRVSR